MRILLVNQFFWPDSAATSQLLTDVARELSNSGHDVYVACGSSGYADAGDGERPDVHIWRSPTFPFSRGKAGRLLSYFSFFVTAAVRGLFSPKFDLVVTLTTPPLLSVLGTVIKNVRGSRHFIWEMDVYPDVAVDVGMWNAGSRLTKLVGQIADGSRLQADGLIVLGPCMRDRLLIRGIPEDKLHVAENWADGTAIQPLPLRTENALGIIYSGNLGLAHDVDTIYEAISRLRNDDRFQFVFAGGGSSREELEQRCCGEHITNVDFRDYVPREDLGRSLGESDIGLVTQKEACEGSVVPSKVYGLLAAGRPVLYIGPKTSTPARIIAEHRCGWQVDVGDSNAVTQLLEFLHSDPALVRDAGQRARQAFLKHYDRPVGVNRICTIIGAIEPAIVTPAVLAQEHQSIRESTSKAYSA